MAKPLAPQRISVDPLYTCAWAPNRTIVVGGAEGPLSIHQIVVEGADKEAAEKLKQLRRVSGPLSGILALSLDNSGEFVAYSGLNGEEITVARIADGVKVASVSLPPLSAWRVAWSPSARVVATGTHTGAVTFYAFQDTEDGHALTELACVRTGSHGHTLALAYSPDGLRLATAHADGRLSIIDATSHTLLASLHAHQMAVRALAFSNDGKMLVTGSDDGRIGIYDTSGVAGDADMSGSGSAASAASSAGAAAAHGHKLHAVATLAGHLGYVTTLTIPLDGRRLFVSGSADKTLKVWSLSSSGSGAGGGGWTCVHTYEAGDRVLCAAFAPDGKALACVTEGGYVNVYNTSSLS